MRSQCSGEYPCARCQKRGTSCIFPASAAAVPGQRQTIILDRGKHLSPTYFDLPNAKAASPERLLSDATVTYLQYFDLFVQRNNFTGNDLPFLADVQNLAKTSRGHGQSDGSHLLHAMLALGAIQSYSMNASKPCADLHFALGAYARSITLLRAAVSESTVVAKTSVLWSTLFLGLFEVS